MSSKIPWSLPEGVEEILPGKALQVENFRRELLDLYFNSGYEYIIPPLLEFKKNLGGKAHEEIIDHAFSFRDDLSSEEVSIRPDMSEQAARIDAYRIKSSESVRLCYAGNVLKSKASPINRSRSTIQVGAEIFGDASIEAEIESILLMIESLKILGLQDITLSLGLSNVTSLVLEKFQALGVDEITLNKALARKSKSDLLEITKGLDKDYIDLVVNLSTLYGDEGIIEEAKLKLALILPNIEDELERLKKMIKKLKKETVNIHIDLVETLGFKYHTGIVFAAYADKAGHALAKGGRYDGLSHSNNQPRPAVGFDLDLLAVTNLIYKE
tara:strand:+ start:320 stop:1300 length:981 start_codon:yes stop_codon:yes gene_type:complete